MSITEEISDINYNKKAGIQRFPEPDVVINNTPVKILVIAPIIPIIEFATNIKPIEGKFIDPIEPIVVTLVTAGCKIEPPLNEIKLGPMLRPVSFIPLIQSNYGINALADYECHFRTKRPNKRENIPQQKKRKQNGNGSCMNSCVQYNVRLSPNANKLYKVKRFRKTNMQVPGGLYEDLSDIVEVVKKVIAYERTFCDASTKITSQLTVSMINYKFLLTNKYLIDTHRLLELLLTKQQSEQVYPVPVSPTTPDEDIYTNSPYIYNANFDHNNVIIVVSFSTPILDKPNKKIIVRISYKGKVNIQGGMADRRPTINIYNYILNLFRSNQDLFIIPPLTDDEYLKQNGNLDDIIYDEYSEYEDDEEYEYPHNQF